MLSNSSQPLSQYLSNLSLPSWLAMSFNWQEENKRYFDIPEQNLQIQFFKDGGWIGEVYQNKKRQTLSLDFEKNISILNLFTHDIFQKIIEEKINWLKQNSKVEKVNPNEFRSLQWIQATFNTLTQGISKAAGDRNLLLEVKIFNGIKDQQYILRLMILSLDIEIYFLPAQILEVKVTDTYKKEIIFQQFFSEYKNDFFNEIIKLLNHLANQLEVK